MRRTRSRPDENRRGKRPLDARASTLYRSPEVISLTDPRQDDDIMVQAADRVQNAFAESIRVKRATADECGEMIATVAVRLIECFRSGGQVLLFGNGGSAADAQHIASEWVGRYLIDRPALPAIALTANSSEFTAIGNDYGFDHVFARGIEAHGRPGDVAIGISTSGDSANVLAAVDTARQRGLATVGLLGKGGGKLASAVDYPIIVPSVDTPRIQESHITIGHILCELIEDAMFSAKPTR